MARAHVLETSGGLTRVVIHGSNPDGCNAAGASWREVFLAAGETGNTCLQQGALPGQVSADEMAALSDGSVVEFVCDLPVACTDMAGLMAEALRLWVQAEAARMERYALYGMVITDGEPN